MKHFLSLKDWPKAQLSELIENTLRIKTAPDEFRTVLSHKTVGLLFMKPSTRTRVSFEVGINQLGGDAAVLSGRELQLGRGETVADTARVLSRYLDALMARVFEHDVLIELAEYASIPIINGLSDLFHPCQGLCDFFTIWEHFGAPHSAVDLSGMTLAYVGDGNNMAHSLLLGAAQLGVNVNVASPPGYQPDSGVLVDTKKLAQTSNSSVQVTSDPREAVENAHVIYSDVWTSMGQEAEKKKRLEAFAGFQVTSELFKLAHSDAIFMHCLPAHRGEEVEAAVIDGPRSIVFDQAENRLHSQKALLTRLLKTDLSA